MKNNIKILILIFCIGPFLPTYAQTTTCDTCDDNLQFVSWGITAAPNLVGYRFNLEDSPDNPDRIYPNIGFDAGAFFEFHINRHWSLQMAASGDLERILLIKNDTSNHLTTIGMDIEILACYRLWKKSGAWFAKLGPYTHFVFYNHINSNGNISNLYTRILANDPRTGEPRFLMNDFNAGLSVSLGWESKSHWEYALNMKWGVSDLLNQESHTYFIKPYHIGFQLSYHFL